MKVLAWVLCIATIVPVIIIIACMVIGWTTPNLPSPHRDAMKSFIHPGMPVSELEGRFGHPATSSRFEGLQYWTYKIDDGDVCVTIDYSTKSVVN